MNDIYLLVLFLRLIWLSESISFFVDLLGNYYLLKIFQVQKSESLKFFIVLVRRKPNVAKFVNWSNLGFFWHCHLVLIYLLLPMGYTPWLMSFYECVWGVIFCGCGYYTSLGFFRCSGSRIIVKIPQIQLSGYLAFLLSILALSISAMNFISFSHLSHCISAIVDLFSFLFFGKMLSYKYIDPLFPPSSGSFYGFNEIPSFDLYGLFNSYILHIAIPSLDVSHGECGG